MQRIVKIAKFDSDGIIFSDGTKMFDKHEQQCCESHWVEFGYIYGEDWQDLEFDILSNNFIEEVPDYGIRLVPINGHPISVPGYGVNNGYYSSNLSIVIENKKDNIRIERDISDCQDVNYE